MKDNKHFNIENFDDKIDEWHNSDSELPLNEYLGLTKDEYEMFVLNKPKSNNSKKFGFYYKNRIGWFRIFGCGLKWKDVTVHPLLFSERNGYSKGKLIGKWYIGILK